MDKTVKSFATAALVAALGAFAVFPSLGESAWRCLPPIEPKSPSKLAMLPFCGEEASDAGTAGKARIRTRRVAPSGPVNIDLLIVYDSRAALWAARNGGVEDFAAKAVNRSNAALAKTGLDSLFSFRLVGVMTLATDCGTEITTNILESLQFGVGEFEGVAKKRNELGADIVSLFVDTGTAEGEMTFFALDQKGRETV